MAAWTTRAARAASRRSAASRNLCLVTESSLVLSLDSFSPELVLELPVSPSSSEFESLLLDLLLDSLDPAVLVLVF